MPTPEQQALLDKGNQLGQRASQQTGVPFPITGSTLAQPSPTIQLSPTKPQTETASTLSYLANLSANTQTTAKASQDSLSQLLNFMNTEQGQTGLTDQAYSQPGGVDQLNRELTDIKSQMLGEQHGLQRTIENLQNNTEGLTRSGVAGKIDEAQRASLRKQADLAVIQMAKQGQYDSAKSIADRAVSAILEKQKQKLDYLTFQYKENKDAFTKAEQRDFEANQAERERQLQNQEYRLRAEFDAKIKQQDPLYQAQLSKARFEAQKLRNEITPLSTPIQLSKIKNNIYDTQDLATNPALASAVGPTRLARGQVPFTAGHISFAPARYSGATQNFIGSVEQLRSNLNLDKLIAAKGSGATFGALSDQELRLLGSAATKLGSWAVTNKSGQVTGYDVDEKSFKAELDKINNYAKLDYVLKGGDPAEVGIQLAPDGSMWAQNSDGTLSQLQ